MSLTDCKSESPREALENFEKAVRAHEMIGAQDPEDRPGIEEEYKAAKAELLVWFSYLPRGLTR